MMHRVKREEDLLRRTICGECSKLDFIITLKLNVENAQKTIMSLLPVAVLTSSDKQDDTPEKVVASVHERNYAEVGFISNPDESGESSETSVISEDMTLADPLEGQIKLEQSCDDETSPSSNCKEFSDNKYNQQFLPSDMVIEFVEAHPMDETFSATENSNDTSNSEDITTDTEVIKGKRKKAKSLKGNQAGRNQVENKAAKQPAWTSSMEEEVQNFYQFICELCASDTQPFKNFSSLCRHFRSEHETEGYLKCCKRKMYCRSHLYQHMILHTRPEMYKCPECDKQLCGPINLKQHLQIFHLPKTQLPFRCSVCGRGFATKTAVENHEKSQHFLSHEEKFVHECDICGKRFASVAGVSEHKKQVHEQIRPLLCDICAKAFPNQSRLRKHMTSHSTSENVKCPHCDQRLKNYGRLQVHMKRHQGVVHACQQCDKCYPTRRLLQRHSKTHSDDRPHQCSICGKRYRESSHLKTHFNQHTGAMPFSCQWCPKRFSASGPFYTHRKKMHSQELAQANQATQPT